MKISVVGTGYVGLVSGVCLAEKNHQVICVDKDEDKVNKINQGMSPIYEKGLDVLLEKNLGNRLIATTDLRSAVLDSELSIIAVGTPFDGAAIDTSYVKQVSEEIGRALRDKRTYHVVVVKSTVVPGTTDGVVLPILEKQSNKRAGVDFGVGMNPEFLREGEAIDDFMAPDRIVLGGVDARTRQELDRLYEAFCDVDVIKTNNKTAEMIKYASNSLLATMISFSNEIANLCSSVGEIDAMEVMRGVHLDKRLSPILPDGQRIVPMITTYLEPGCGFGGSCFPKDVKALISYGKSQHLPMHLLNAVIEINNEQPKQVLRKLKKYYDSLKGVNVAVLGLAFKPGTDDMRESSAIPIVKALINEGARIKAYDPVASDAAKKLFTQDNIAYGEDLVQTVKDVDAILLLTRWDEFEKLPRLLETMPTQPLLVDGRRLIDRYRVSKYEGIGL